LYLVYVWVKIQINVKSAEFAVVPISHRFNDEAEVVTYLIERSHLTRVSQRCEQIA